MSAQRKMPTLCPNIGDSLDALSGSCWFSTLDLLLHSRSLEMQISSCFSKVEAVASWPVGTCVSEVRSFLGTASYHWKYIQGFADIASPLTNLTKKNQKFVWTEKCQHAFERLKEALVTAPVLAYPTREGKFVLDTDASATAIGAVLSQIQDGEEKVIAYESCALSSSRQNYCTTYSERYAVVRFVKYFSHYLWGRPFLVRSDHSSLKWLKNFKQPEGMVAGWIAGLWTPMTSRSSTGKVRHMVMPMGCPGSQEDVVRGKSAVSALRSK